MITVDEFKQSTCNTKEWWQKHNFDQGIEVLLDDGTVCIGYYTIVSAVALLNELNPQKTIAEWEVS